MTFGMYMFGLGVTLMFVVLFFVTCVWDWTIYLDTMISQLPLINVANNFKRMDPGWMIGRPCVIPGLDWTIAQEAQL